MREIQVIIRTPPGTRPVAVDPADKRQCWRCLAGAAACAASLDTHDDEDDPAPLAGFLAHWRRPGKAGTRLPRRQR